MSDRADRLADAVADVVQERAAALDRRVAGLTDEELLGVYAAVESLAACRAAARVLEVRFPALWEDPEVIRKGHRGMTVALAQAIGCPVPPLPPLLPVRP